jgi:hypothetical protein
MSVGLIRDGKSKRELRVGIVAEVGCWKVMIATVETERFVKGVLVGTTYCSSLLEAKTGISRHESQWFPDGTTKVD